MIRYEWTIELIDPGGDIIESDFSDSLKELPIWTPANSHKVDVGLVMNSGTEVTGIEDRLWAYIKNGILPEYFSNAQLSETGYKVPARFHKELSKHLDK